MELSLTAPFAGTVDVRVAGGEQVALGATLFVVTELSDVSRPGPIHRLATRRGVRRDHPSFRRPRPVAARGGDDLRGRAARRAAEREGDRPDRDQGASSSSRLHAAGLPVVESTSFVHPKWVPQLADAADLVDVLVDELGDVAREMPVLVPNERGLDRALEKGLRHIAIFGSATETFAQRNLNRSLDEQFAMFEPTVRRARDAGLDVRAYVSMCFGDPWEGGVADRPGGGRRQAALRPGRLPAVPGRHDRHRHGRPRRRAAARVQRGRAAERVAGDALPRHLRAGAVQRGRGAAARHHHVRRVGRRARRLPLRQERDRQPGHRGPGVAARPASASSTASTSTRWSSTSVWMAGELGRPSPSAVVRALSAVGQTSRHEPCRLPARRCAQDGDDVPPGPAGAEQGRARPARRALPAAAAREPVPARPRPARDALGRPAGRRRRRVGRR